MYARYELGVIMFMFISAESGRSVCPQSQTAP